MKRTLEEVTFLLSQSLALFCFLNLRLVIGQQQTFRVRPNDTEVLKGQTAILHCQIDNKQGQLQWVKNGFGLGFDRAIKGESRYTVIGNEALGENNLRVINTQLDDDAEFQCQVSPAIGDPHSALQAAAYLSILVPPQSPRIEFRGSSNTSLVEVAVSQSEINVTCIIPHGKPAAHIKWLRGGQQLTEESIQNFVDKTSDKLETARSILTIRPRKEFNQKIYTCQGTHSAIDSPITTSMKLSVKYAPETPDISGYKSGKAIKTGERLTLTCRSKGGNPTAYVEWFKNGDRVDSSHTRRETETVNVYSFRVDSSDNNAIYRCDAWNDVSEKRLTAAIKLTVHFGPMSVQILGPSHAKAGETIVLHCRTSNSNPRATISWTKDGKPLTDVIASPTYEADTRLGGWITLSNITVRLVGNDSETTYECKGENGKQRPTASKTLSVLYAPEKPVITGYATGTQIHTNTILTMRCTAHGGNPLAEVTWWKGSRQLTERDGIKCQTNTQIAKKYSQCQLERITKQGDNAVDFVCKANNTATPVPLQTVVTLSIQFPPKNVQIKSSPVVGKAGQKMTLTCTSASSNPAAEITWTRDDKPLTGRETRTVIGENSGLKTVSILDIYPSAADDKATYYCTAKNTAMNQAETIGHVISVKYKPVFVKVDSRKSVLEGDSVVINMTGQGNPKVSKYEWFRNGAKLVLGGPKRNKVVYFTAVGGVLNVTNVTRNDRGIYTVQAKNAEGASNTTFVIDVQYAATITHISPNQLVNPGGRAIFECRTDANPMVNNVIQWSTSIVGFNMNNAKKVKITNNNQGTSTLTVYIANRSTDMGYFTCKTQNKIGGPSTKRTALLVKFKPEADKNQLTKAASAERVTAKLSCLATGAPKVQFTWLKGKTAVNVTLSKYTTEVKELDLAKYESILHIHNVSKSDYDTYTCKMSNSEGQMPSVIDFDGQSKPDSPSNVKLVNFTHNAVTLSWQKGFDGGLPVTYNVRYTVVGDNSYTIVGSIKKSVFTFTGLSPGVNYELTVMAKNKQGESGYNSKPVFVTTKDGPPPFVDEVKGGDEAPLIIILSVCIVGLILLACNALLIVFFVRRRRRKLEKGDGSETLSRTNTLEMYPSSDRPLYPGGHKDTESCSTYDKSMDDYTDSYRSFDDEEDVKRIFLPPLQTDPYQPTANTDPYASRGPIYGTPATVDAQRSFPVQSYYDSSGYKANSLPRSRFEGDASNPDDNYADQLRKNTLQKSLTGLNERGNERSRPNSPSRSTARTPPPPPTRYVSRDMDQKPIPPLPARNYESQEMPRYTPQPGTEYRPSRTDYNPNLHTNYSKPQTNNIPSEMRGHLV